MAAPRFRFRPARLSFPAGDQFFEEGDVQRHLYLRLLASPVAPEKEEEEGSRGAGPALRCPWEDCGSGPFSSLPSLEHHYASAHRSACAACRGRSFPSQRLLELHLREKHDPLLLPQTTLPFHCLVEGCPEAFRSPSERKEHLLEPPFQEPSGLSLGLHFGSTSAKGRQVQSTHSKDSGGSSSVSVVPMDVAEGQEEVLPAATDAMEVGPSGSAEEQQDEEEVATFQQVPPSVFVASEKWVYRSRVPATISFGQGAPRAFEGWRRRKKF
ncbi:zinc finger protein 511 [Sceloporus undulatus]|uniref:zinc finger protein 511 n=1 Tax=Sceloporus undulatus TaxID=8520 RepID=UPI001C4DD5E0|nr:zinc finger protein 511 [Sceloporus undulatus]